MSTFTEQITLENPADKVRVECGARKDIRKITVDAIPDTGAWTLAINEKTRQALGLEIVDVVYSTLADGSRTSYQLTEGVTIHWKNRSTITRAVVVPTAEHTLLGALPLEDMDLMVDPVNERLTGVHGEERLHLLLSVSASAA